MPMLEFTDSYLSESFGLVSGKVSLAISAISLPFSLIKLIALIIWVYLCLYLVQYIQFSPLVPKRFKPIAYILTLFTGPIFLLVLLIIDAVKKSFRGGQEEGLLETIKQQLTGIVSSRFSRPREDSTLKLLDSSGRSIDQVYSHSDSKQKDRHIFNLTEHIVADALARRASDILIDPKDEATYTIRLRIDGVLRTVNELRADICRAVLNSIKAVSSMDISEKRRPQDGAFIAKKGQEVASFRVASAGVLHGEKLSIRVLNKDAATFTLASLQLSQKHSEILEDALKKPSGMILVCGPTGSGKTTSLYAMLNAIDRYTHNVITVEDPVEAVLPQTSQIEINPKADITFAKALRSILRQDPDVICVGEIRDEETAEIALRASQTGHLVLATIHCDSNATALIRLLDLGVSPLLLSSGLSLLVSQRLIRRLCQHCKKPAQLTQALIDDFYRKGIDYKNIFRAVGCKNCENTGYFGRMAIFDPLVVTNELKAHITDNKALINELKTDGKRRDIFNIRREGLKRVAAGITSLEELKRVVG